MNLKVPVLVRRILAGYGRVLNAPHPKRRFLQRQEVAGNAGMLVGADCLWATKLGLVVCIVQCWIWRSLWLDEFMNSKNLEISGGAKTLGTRRQMFPSLTFIRAKIGWRRRAGIVRQLVEEEYFNRGSRFWVGHIFTRPFSDCWGINIGSTDNSIFIIVRTVPNSITPSTSPCSRPLYRSTYIL